MRVCVETINFYSRMIKAFSRKQRAHLKEASMNRRNFIKGALLTGVVLTSQKSFGSEYKHKITKELNRLTNRENPSVLEQKHVPAIETPGTVRSGSWFDVKVTVGFKKEHPSTPAHWITMIKLLVDGNEVADTNFKVGGTSASSATFRIKLDKASTLEAVEHCNLHGTWIGEPVKINIA
jgi:superoxide reductase